MIWHKAPPGIAHSLTPQEKSWMHTTHEGPRPDG
jgi:hypothetical protein